MGKKKKTGSDQPNLFGEVDMVFNTLDTEKTIVREEIETAETSIERLEKKIDALQKREIELDKAIKVVGKQRKDLEPKK